MKTPGCFVGETVALVQFHGAAATCIRGYPAALKIGYNLLREKAFKDELLMAGCFPKASCLRSCLFGDFSLLADTLPLFRLFRRVEVGRGGQKAPFPNPAHRTVHADFPHTALRLDSSRAHGGGPDEHGAIARPRVHQTPSHQKTAGATRRHLMTPPQEVNNALIDVVINRRYAGSRSRS